ncbi:MAG TPA: CHAD domain-containing protein, partial [Polyangia bacterium]
ARPRRGAMSKTAPSRKALSHAVPRRAARLVRRAHRSLAGAAAPFGEDLHTTRTALKRARALLQLVADGKKPRNHLGALARRIGPVRDAGIAVVTFDRIIKSEGLRMTGALETVRQRLVQRRDELEADPKTDCVLAKVERALQREARALKRGGVKRPKWPTVKRGCKASYREARRALACAYREGSDAAFHDLRKAVKRHLYQLKELRLPVEAEAAQRLDGLDQVGETLGEAQDLAMFEATLQNEAACFSNEADCRRLCRLLQRRRTQLRGRVRALAHTLFADRPAVYAASL